MQVSNDLKKWLANSVTQMSAAQIIYHQSMVIKAEFCVDHSFLPHQYNNTGENNGQCLTSQHINLKMLFFKPQNFLSRFGS